jgi:hypothetical protein
MKTNTHSLSERRHEILTAIGQIPVIVEGTLTQKQRERGGSRPAIYHQLQRWRGGRNDTRHIPADRVSIVKQGIEGYQRVQALVSEIARLDEVTALTSVQDDSKKKSTKQ